ncbi:MAG: sugar transferase [Terrimicrobiaceae bacterium]
MKRLFDCFSAAVLLLILLPVYLGIALAVRLTSPGPALFRTRRVGRANRHFQMYKFRTMRTDTPQVATHLMPDPAAFLTPIGSFLRKTSLDEIPQLVNVIKGDMSLVGPRPALFNQDDLVTLRTRAGVDSLLPGITGWAQVNGRDELPIAVKVDYDAFYLRHQSFLLDLKILGLTVVRVFRRDGVSH